MNLTVKEKDLLLDLLGSMNKYDVMAILCRIYDDSELEEASTEITKIFIKLSDKK